MPFNLERWRRLPYSEHGGWFELAIAILRRALLDACGNMRLSQKHYSHEWWYRSQHYPVEFLKRFDNATRETVIKQDLDCFFLESSWGRIIVEQGAGIDLESAQEAYHKAQSNHEFAKKLEDRLGNFRL